MAVRVLSAAAAGRLGYGCSGFISSSRVISGGGFLTFISSSRATSGLGFSELLSAAAATGRHQEGGLVFVSAVAGYVLQLVTAAAMVRGWGEINILNTDSSSHGSPCVGRVVEGRGN